MIFSNCVLQKFTSFNSTRNLHNFESLHYLRDCPCSWLPHGNESLSWNRGERSANPGQRNSQSPRICEHFNDQVTCFQAVRTRFSHTSYKQRQASKSGILTSVELVWKSSKKNGKSTGQPKKLRKVWEFPFSSLLFPFTDSYERSYIISQIFSDSGCFLCFPMKFCAQQARIDDLPHTRSLTAVQDDPLPLPA